MKKNTQFFTQLVKKTARYRLHQTGYNKKCAHYGIYQQWQAINAINKFLKCNYNNNNSEKFTFGDLAQPTAEKLTKKLAN